jgi:hypothetical protein
MDEGQPTGTAATSTGARTVHYVVPATGRPLCGYEEESARPGEGASVPCPECSALLRSGLVPRGSTAARRR